jgi:hypothetical protein
LTALGDGLIATVVRADVLEGSLVPVGVESLEAAGALLEQPDVVRQRTPMARVMGDEVLGDVVDRAVLEDHGARDGAGTDHAAALRAVELIAEVRSAVLVDPGLPLTHGRLGERLILGV